jgi:citrate lyase subunit beta / citryl-CoA lyase
MNLPRTYLFVPGDRPERFAKALATAADAVVIDLEDAVAPAAKAAARDAVAAHMAACVATSRDRIVVRINDQSTPWFEDDLEMLRSVEAPTVLLPKVERVATIARVRSVCPQIAVLALIESARGVLAAEALADALAEAPAVQRLVFGTIDFALDMNLQGGLATTIGLDYAASRLALASRAAGLAPPVAGVTVAMDDEAQLRSDLMRALAHGFSAKLCIHPKQIAAVHALLAPSAEETAWAHRVLAAAHNAESAAGAEGAAGAVQLDGQMIDKPVIERARRLVQRTR